MRMLRKDETRVVYLFGKTYYWAVEDGILTLKRLIIR